MRKYVPAVVLAAMMVFASMVMGAKPAVAEDPVTFEEGFGAAAGFALYDVQVVLGITADAYAKDVYTAEDTNSIIAEQKGLLDTMNDYVVKLQKRKTISPEDKKSLGEMSGCISKLHATADALLAYVKDPTQDNADAFQTNRKASYAALAELLGLEK